ncbi:MAG TPA: formate/nitrite transporter family protein [Xanthobacteraceae bacterium]
MAEYANPSISLKSPPPAGAVTAPPSGPALAPQQTVAPAEMGVALAADAGQKAKFPASHLLIRGGLCTPFLAYGASMVFAMVAAGIPLGAAGFMFPAGYVTLSFLGLEMVTGSFATMAVGMYAGTVTPYELVRNWFWTLTGNLIGGVCFAYLLWYSFTYGGTVDPNPMLKVIAGIAEKKVAYSQHGAAGWVAAIGMGILCNWLVSLGSVMSKATRSTVGRLLLMWIPIGMFFALGFEHTVVNMWLFPCAIFSGANVSFYDWWVWNQIPVTIGNILGAMVLNGTLWYWTHTLQK